MKKQKYAENGRAVDVTLLSLPSVIVISAIAIVLGVFFCLTFIGDRPIDEGEIVRVSGEYEEYSVGRNYAVMKVDGTAYYLHPHTLLKTLQEPIESIKPGTVVYISVNPHNNYVIGLATDDTEYMDIAVSQGVIYSYEKSYIFIGVIAISLGIALLIAKLCLMKGGKKKKRKSGR